jgi:SNF2 family DNA or RNA helicase
MLIHKKKKAIVLKLRNPERVTTVIPTAITVQSKGGPLLAIPHRPDETRVLRNLGFDIPDPMPIHYEWLKVNGRHDPFEAQRATANFLAMHSRAYVLNGMGTGKTNSALWAYDYLRRTKQVRKMLVVCPLSTMERTWADSVFNTFPHLDAVVLYGSRDRRKNLLKQEAHIYIINVDGLSTIKDDLAKRDDIDVVVVDELALARNAATERWKLLNTVCNRQTLRRVWGMTGSPTPNAPTDAWAQCKLVTPESPEVPKYFGKFRDTVMRQATQFK